MELFLALHLLQSIPFWFMCHLLATILRFVIFRCIVISTRLCCHFTILLSLLFRCLIPCFSSLLSFGMHNFVKDIIWIILRYFTPMSSSSNGTSSLVRSRLWVRSWVQNSFVVCVQPQQALIPNSWGQLLNLNKLVRVCHKFSFPPFYSI